MKIYHNPRCTKSREALKYLEEKGVEVEVIQYLKEVPTEKELEDLLMKLNLKPIQIIRRGEKIFKEKFRGAAFNDHEWIKIMVEYPKLIERPIIVKGNRAILGRPLQKVIDLIK
jgi:arsenate reductase